jgi:hypothetical protein
VAIEAICAVVRAATCRLVSAPISAEVNVEMSVVVETVGGVE